MDVMTMIIGICLVWTGAAVIGYPVGWYLGKRSERRRFESFCTNQRAVSSVPAVVQNCRCRLEAKDILNADVLEEVQ